MATMAESAQSFHEMQILRQQYCELMCVTFQQKMEAMAQEADELKRSDQTF